jgi:hypothetical protein
VIYAVATDSAGNARALEITPSIPSTNDIQVSSSVPPVPVFLSSLAAANGTGAGTGTVTFSAATSISSGDSITYAESGWPAGLVSGTSSLSSVGGTAAPGTYSVKVTASDSFGAVLTGTVPLTVLANDVYMVGSNGDEVNPFGYGFDVYQQHASAGAHIVGWTSTRSDPATDFLVLAGTQSGAVQFEYAPSDTGTGTGLCISDPNGGAWASDPLPDGLILAGCNDGPYQQFVPQSNGTLKNWATHLFINPDGKGAQLRDAATATPWGGSVYGWTETANLPW